MFVTVVAVMCHLMVAHPTISPDRGCTAEEAKVEEIVTDTEKDASLNFQSCMIGQANLANWKSNHPVYFKAEWRIGRVKCVPGHYEPRGEI